MCKGAKAGMMAGPEIGKMAGGPLRALKEGTCAQLRILDLHSGEDRLLLQSPTMIEAPNWSPDGASIYVNGQGRIGRVDVESAGLDWIVVEGLETANNDHLISPDGKTLYLTADGAVWAVAANGGVPNRLTPQGVMRYYLHAISPDGALMACTTIDRDDPKRKWGLRLVPVTGGSGSALIAGTAPVDGPEWSVDGQWIWFNGEIGADIPGHARLFRIRPDGRDLQQMSDDETVDWFPHASPDGEYVAYIAYPPGTLGHPGDLPVSLRLMSAQGGPWRTLATLQGGQGTLNVNSWSPCSRYLAYMAYPDA